jgi:hypothetical protein
MSTHPSPHKGSQDEALELDSGRENITCEPLGKQQLYVELIAVSWYFDYSQTHTIHTPLTRLPAPSTGARTQSLTPPFQSAILPSLILTTTTLMSSSCRKDCLLASSSSALLVDWLKTFCDVSSLSKVLFSRCCSLHHFSSSDPTGNTTALPLMVALMEPI